MTDRQLTDADPVADFAAALRRLHIDAGKPNYQELMRRTSFGRTVLSNALNGNGMPTWQLVEQLVRALGDDPERWRPRWAAAKAQLDGLTGVGDLKAAVRRRRWMWWVVPAALGVVAVVVVGALWWPGRSGPSSTAAGTSPAIDIVGGACMQVTATDIRVFTDAHGEQTWTRWTHGTVFWIDPDSNTGHRYRTTLRDGRSGWVTSDPKFVTPASSCH